MVEPAPNAELLHSLGQLARGLSALFWGLPLALVVCVQTAKAEWLRPLGVVPPILATGLLYYALGLMSHFQRQERVWRSALGRARLVALINLCLSPFIYWWSRIPSQPFYSYTLDVLIFSGLLFLFLLNPLLRRLSAMLPDETLRQETALFTTLNRYLLLATFSLAAIHLVLLRADPLFFDKLFSLLSSVAPARNALALVVNVLERGDLWLILFALLLPVAMTMALLWKIKEVILASVFGPAPETRGSAD